MKLYRFSLRNQKKIADRLGEDYLKLLLNSLKAYFKDRTEEVPEYGETDKEGNDTGRIYVMIPSVAKNSEIEFQFVLLHRTYNVYNLAYFSSIG